jgi:hypothetical protein
LYTQGGVTGGSHIVIKDIPSRPVCPYHLVFCGDDVMRMGAKGTSL